MSSKESNVLRRLITQTPSWMLPGKEDELLKGMSIEK
jgi:hypothetical protein